MANNLFNSLGKQSMQNPMNNIMSQLQQLQSNPIQFLAQRKLNIPADFQGGPKEMIQHLLNSGQMTQNQFNQLQNYVNKLPH